MNTMLLKLYVKFQDLMNREEGQDLVEYALVVALIAFGATAGMKASGHRAQHCIHQHQHGSGQLHGLTSCEAGSGRHRPACLLLRGRVFRHQTRC